VEFAVEDADFEDDENTDNNQAERSNLGKNLLQMASAIIVCTDKRGGTTEESVGASRNDDSLGFTLLAGGSTRVRISNKSSGA
jgi:hypothetical protein